MIKYKKLLKLIHVLQKFSVSQAIKVNLCDCQMNLVNQEITLLYKP